jgi:hypothetical protein
MANHDIKIIIRLKNSERLIDPKFLIQSLEHLENALYESDRKDIEGFSDVLSEQIMPNNIFPKISISKVINDASLERLRRYKNKRLILTEARTGSIEIIGVVAAVGYYVLDKTIGETVGEAFRESNTGVILKQYFKSVIDKKALYIVERLRESIGSKKRQGEVQYLPSTNENEPTTIVLEISENKDNYEHISSLGEKLDK